MPKYRAAECKIVVGDQEIPLSLADATGDDLDAVGDAVGVLRGTVQVSASGSVTSDVAFDLMLLNYGILGNEPGQA